MKTLITMGVLCLFSLGLFGQSKSGPVKIEPRNAQGFVVVDGSLPNYKYWKLQIIERVYDQVGNFTDKIVQRNEIWDKTYFRIPSTFMEDNEVHEYLYQVIVFDGNGNIILEGDPTPTVGDGTAYILGTRWECNGYDYAFRIQQYVHPNGGNFRYQLESAGTTAIGLDGIATPTPYREYMYHADFSVYNDDDSWLDYHDLTGTEIPEDAIDAKVYNVLPGITYYDKNGFELSNQNSIVGVQKTRGLWQGAVAMTDAIITDYSIYNIDNVLTLFNLHSNMEELINDGIFTNELVCITPPNITQIDQDAPTGLGQDCIMNYDNATEDFTDYDGDGDFDVYDMVQDYIDCEEDEMMADFVIHQISELSSGEPILAHSYNNLSSTNNALPSYTLQRGLYKATFAKLDGTQLSFCFEITDAMNCTQTLASLVGVNVFPVPVESDIVFANITSPKDMNFTLTILDNTGGALSENKISIEAGHNENHKIALPSDYKGIFIVLLKFEDGSYKTVTAIKN